MARNFTHIYQLISELKEDKGEEQDVLKYLSLESFNEFIERVEALVKEDEQEKMRQPPSFVSAPK